MAFPQTALLFTGILTGVWSAISVAAPETRVLARQDGSRLTYHISRPSHDPAPIVFNLQGSSCRGYYGDDSGMAQALNSAVIRVEKRGFPAEASGCPVEYLEHNTVDGRVDDYLAVIGDLRSDDAIWDKQSVAWIGGSEGAYVASLVAAKIPETKAAVLLGMGGGMSFADERAELLRKHGSVCDISVLSDLVEQFRLMFAEPTGNRTWCGNTNTYKWWASILPVKPVEMLKQVEFAIYLAVGSSDTMIPPESADALANSFHELGKANLTLVKHIGLDHNFLDANGISHARDVYSLAIAWLKARLNR